MQTILGAGGNIGKELAKELSNYTKNIRLVSRNPKKVNENDELMAADLTDPKLVDKAIEGSDVVYVTISFNFNAKEWEQKWPPFMRSVIESCKRHKAKLVFFDNIFMYDRDHLSHATEDTPVRPTSRKGEVRRQLADMVMSEADKGELKALIARATDFIAPTNCALTESVIVNFKKGKKGNWFASLDKIHNFNHWRDAAKGTAILGNTPDAFGQVWHLPAINEKLTGKEWIDLVAKKMNVKPKVSVLPVWMMGIVGLFMPIVKEFKELAYLYDRDNYFDSSKFEKRFGYKPVSAETAIDELLEALNGK